MADQSPAHTPPLPPNPGRSSPNDGSLRWRCVMIRKLRRMPVRGRGWDTTLNNLIPAYQIIRFRETVALHEHFVTKVQTAI
jgi:hypothetical protein